MRSLLQIKKISPAAFIIFMLFSGNSIYAQTIYGMTSAGGASGYGVLYGVNPDGSTFRLMHSFGGSPDGANPYASVVMGPGTRLYGTTRNGGANDSGSIFSYDTATSAYQKLADFTGANGANPAGDLTWFNNKFYGLTPFGGANHGGTIFSYDPGSGTLSDVFDLTNATGINPYGRLTVLNNKLYFLTTLGGANGAGTLAVFDPAALTCTSLYELPTVTIGPGIRKPTPRSCLVVINDLLYGVTMQGASNGQGEIFSFDPASNTFTTIFNTTGLTPPVREYGVYPSEITAYNGNIYGVMEKGDIPSGGTAFIFNPVTRNYFAWAEFFSGQGSTGFLPLGAPVVMSDSTFIGATLCGGQANMGIVYKVDMGAGSINKELVRFIGSNGENPMYGQLFMPGPSIPLPLGLEKFTGLLTSAGRRLNWSASSISPGGRFELQRSIDARAFTAITTIPMTRPGLSASYTYTDAEAMPDGINVVYYRLKMQEEPGPSSYSNVVAISLNTTHMSDDLRLVNTLVTGTAFLEYKSGEANGTLDLRIINLAGQVLQQQLLPVAKGVNSYTLDLQSLPKGSYVLQAAGKSIRFVKL